jgi:alpha-glucosidase
MSATRQNAQLAEALLRPGPQIDPDTEWWRGAMFYEVYVRSFFDSNGDGVGDLRGVCEKLDYIASLGVDGVWLSPFFTSPQKDFGYDVSDFTTVDPSHGSLDDFIRLVEQAHAKGLKVLADFVPCHTSDQHEWFLESRADPKGPKGDWYIWADAAADGSPPNNWLSSFGGPAWTWEPRRAQYYYHPFLTCQPALNLRNPDVLGAMIENMEFWLDLGVDGFRLDAIQCLCWDPDLRSNPARGRDGADIPFGGGPNNPFTRQLHLFDRDLPAALDIIATMREAVDRYDPPRALIGELADVDSARISVKYTAGEDRLHAVYDFSLINSGHDWHDWLRVLRERSEHIGPGWLMSCLTNHDTERAVTALTGCKDDPALCQSAAKALLFLQATLRGGGIIFQGEELGLPQPEMEFEDLRDPWGINLWPDFSGRDGVRTVMPWKSRARNLGFTRADEPWIAPGRGHEALSVDKQEKDGNSVLNFLRDLLAWRRDNPVLRFGDEDVKPPSAEPIISLRRYDDEREIRCIVNFGPTPRVVPVDGGKAIFPRRNKPRATQFGYELPPMGVIAIECETDAP